MNISENVKNIIDHDFKSIEHAIDTYSDELVLANKRVLDITKLLKEAIEDKKQLQLFYDEILKMEKKCCEKVD